MDIIELNQVSKIYNGENGSAIGIQNISTKFKIGEFVAITGESGAGKSTFLNVVSLLDTYEEGELFIDGKSTIEFKKEDFQKYQSNYVSFVFQEYNLIESFSVIENVMLPLTARGIKKSEAIKKANDALKQVGLDKIAKRRASKLSGGEKQRVVIARSLVSDTPVFACDEPTGNLDSKTSKEIVKVFKEISKNKLILYVTHDFDSIKDVATRHIVLKDGHIIKDVELSKCVEANNPIENKKNKIGFFPLLSLALKSVFKTPKRTILSSFIALAISLASFGLLWGANSIISGASSNIAYSVESYLDNVHTPNRVAVYDVNRSDKKISDIVIGENEYLDKGNLISSIPYFYQYQDRSSTIINHGLIYDELEMLYGTKPSNDNEIAIGLPSNTIDAMGDKLEKYVKGTYLDHDFMISPFSASFAASATKFHVTGVYYNTDKDNTNLISIIFSFPAAKLLSNNMLTLFKSSQRYRDYGNLGSIYSVFPNMSLYMGDKIITTDNDIFSGNKALDYTKIYVNPSYYGHDLIVSYRNTTLTIPANTMISNNAVSTVAFSYQALELILQDDVKFASIFTSDNSSAKEVMKSSISDGIDATVANIPQSSVTSVDIGSLILVVVYAIIFAGLAILFCFIGSLLFAIVYSSKKKDYAILMTLSFSKNDIRVINLFEMLFYFIISSLLSYGIFYLIAKILAWTNNVAISASLLSIFTNPIANVIYFIFNLLFALLVSVWILKRMNKKTRASNMRKDNSLL